MDIIDSHVHVWRADAILYPVIRSLGLPEGFDAPAELLLKEMEAAGVDKAVLVQPSNYEFDNRYLSHCLTAYPGRFIWCCKIKCGIYRYSICI